ncbi:ABC transporter ATP-binding protein [Candidatus Dependentiae bacterium]
MQSLKRILSYTKKYWKFLLISGVTASFYGLFSAAPTYVIKHAVDEIFTKKLESLLIPFILGFVLLFALKGIFMYLSSYYMNWVGNKVVNDIRNDLFEKIIYYPISFFRTKTTGELMSHFLNDIQMIQNASSSAVKNGIRSFFEAIFLLCVAFSQNFKLALIMLLVGPAIGITIKKMGSSIKAASTNIQKNMGEISSSLQEVFVGIREIKAFNGEKIEIKRFNKNLINCFKSIMHNVHIDSLAPAFIETIAMLGSSIVFYIAAHQIMSGTITPGQLTAFFASILLSYQPLKRLINVYSEIQYGIAAADRVFEIIDTNYTSNKIDLTKNLMQKNLTTINSIKFENVTFEYNKQNTIFKNVYLTIKRNERIGIIGPSGSGKSTFCDLILGFIEPTYGNIFINNTNILQTSLYQLRDKIGYVGQKTFLFNDTVRANITYSQTNKNNVQILNACKAAHADEFIQELSQKYKTPVGENGGNLSGGQKQRITIARALLKNPEILIFDEATSSLDKQSEKMIKLAIEENCKQKAVIIISHRLSFLEKMDRIFLIKDQKITEINKNKIMEKTEIQNMQ